VRAPVPPLLCAMGLIVIGLATFQPLVVAAALLGALGLLLVAPAPRGLMLRLAAFSALALVVLNPFVAVEGEHVLYAGPSFWLLDLEVTSEEVLYGIVSGARLATAILATAGFLRLADPDRTHALASRLVPRSALTVALAARLAPTLQRDAGALAETLRLRGSGPARGRRQLIRRGALLIEPLVASSLDRGIDISEAMVARGYGGGTLTRLPEPAWTGGERVAAGAGVLLLTVGVAVIAGLVSYDSYPTAGPLLSSAALLVASLSVAAGAVGTLALRSRS